MRTRLAPLLIAVAIGLLGVGLRRVVPVAPVDESYRDVVRFYRAPEPAAAGNTPETSLP